LLCLVELDVPLIKTAIQWCPQNMQDHPGRLIGGIIGAMTKEEFCALHLGGAVFKPLFSSFHINCSVTKKASPGAGLFLALDVRIRN